MRSNLDPYMRGCVAQNNHSNYMASRIMLRFRPIAPKPTSGDTSAPPASDVGPTSTGKRAKRKYVRVRARKRKKKTDGKSTEKSGTGSEVESSPKEGVVTLQLLPEQSEIDLIKSNGKSMENYNCNSDENSAGDDSKTAGDVGGGPVAHRGLRSVIETWIMVECVTDAYIDGASVGLGFSDSEKIWNLQLDSCPGFVSDCTNKVVWINEAYRKMAAEGEDAAENGIMVWLVVKDNLPQFCPSFACRVRLIQHTRDGQKWNRMVPCDVWRMDFAGFAWKLDVKTALGLGI